MSTYELNQLDPYTFEHLANTLAMRVLGLGHTTFGPGRDGGRDGFYEGDAAYPSETERWSGRWYLQAKYHRPHLTKDAQKWILEQIARELKAFADDPNRIRPDNWIVVTNVDISAVPGTGTFDRARELVTAKIPALADRFHIWGGSKIASLLALYPSLAERYAHFFTPGHVLTEVIGQLRDTRAGVESILRFLIVKQLEDHQYTKLEQAGSSADSRPGIHRLFIDLPYHAPAYDLRGLITRQLLKASARPHRADEDLPDTPTSRRWRRHPDRARVWFVKAGPGHGKSTIGQYFCQIARAALLYQDNAPAVTPAQRALADEIRVAAQGQDLWPVFPRIPVAVDLKDYAEWFAARAIRQSRGVLTYVSSMLTLHLEQDVTVGTLKRMLGCDSWFFVFDGLDEVPHDVKDGIASEIRHFLDHVIVENRADVLALCTSRPQGYSGQFADIDGPTLDLISLDPEQALACAAPVLSIERSEEESRRARATLAEAITSPAISELMTTPLQSHIMAIIVRDGGRPPDRRWQLYTKFYEVIRKREANKNSPDRDLAKLLREGEQLLKTVHNRLGFLLHARAETAGGAKAHLDRTEFGDLVTQAVRQLVDVDVEGTIQTLMAATVNRLVLVTTPDDGNHVRFDIRPLQEFFAAEFLYESVNAEELDGRLALLAGDSHWREVIHFLVSALVESGRRTELAVAIRTLERLNGEQAEDDERVCERRMCRGAVIAARLLGEGVLEQDRRRRGEFRRAVAPLFASTEDAVLSVVQDLRQPSSVAWLRANIMETLRESSPGESLGAGTLALTIGCESEQEAKVVQTLAQMPAAYLSMILPGLRDRHGERKRVRPCNVAAALAAVLLSTKAWRGLSQQAVSALLDIVGRLPDTHLRGVFRGHSDSAMETLSWATRSERLIDSSNTRGFGLLTAHYYSADWSTAGAGGDLPQCDDAACDFALVVGMLCDFHRTGSLQKLRQIHACFGAEAIAALPRRLAAFLPIDARESVNVQFERLLAQTDHNLTHILQNGVVDGRAIDRIATWVYGGRFTHEGWKDLVARHPRIAVNVWSDRGFLGVDRPRALDSRRAAEVLVNAVVRWPELLRTCVPAWGRMIRTVPDRESELRGAFLRCANGGVPAPAYGVFSDPFKVHLPGESALLPYVLTAAIVHEPWRGELLSILEVQERLTECVGFVTRDLVRRYSTLPPFALAAMEMMAMLHAGDIREEDSEVLVRAYTPQTAEWLLRTLARLIGIMQVSETVTMRAFVGRFLDLACNDYHSRAELDQVLWMWRESSRKPATAAGVVAPWLAQ